MTDQNTMAIYAMCAIVITLYAMRDGHTHYLPDLFGLALALAAPNQSYAIGAVIILAIIRHSTLAYALSDFCADWLLPILLPGARYMSIPTVEAERLEDAYKQRVLPPDHDEENTEEPQPVAEKDDQKIIAGKIEFAALAVMSGALGMTEATRLASGVQSGRKYSKYSNLIKREIAAREKRFADLDSNRQQVPPP